MITAPQFAALDLGSNSFRLEIAQYEFGQMTTIAYLKETVRLGAGLNEQGELDTVSMQRGWDCLARFAEKIAKLNPVHIRCAATQTLREAVNRDVFIKKGEQILGVSINIVPGQEEARLVYSGVAHLLPESNQRRLVIDIGGRSTEVIRGHGLLPDLTQSFPIGSVSYSQRYFAEELTEKSFKRATTAGCSMFETMADEYLALGWDLALGSSGTVGAVAELLKENHITDGTITRAGLAWLKQQCLEAKAFTNIQLQGLKEDRKPVLAGGVAILLACFETFNLEALTPAEGALRTGVLFDLLVETTGTSMPKIDLRSQTISALWKRFYCDQKQAERVAHVASELFAALQSLASKDSTAINDANNVLWASQLHEIGRCISYADYHRHGSYIVANIDAVGFNSNTQTLLVTLILGQKGALKKVATALEQPVFTLQLLALRLAIIFCHARRTPEPSAYAVTLLDNTVSLKLQEAWVDKHPQSLFLLEEEVAHWKKQGALALVLDV